MMASSWILAADAAEARRVTRDKKYGDLVERRDWEHNRIAATLPETVRPEVEEILPGHRFAAGRS